jgi:hypothetical protein
VEASACRLTGLHDCEATPHACWRRAPKLTPLTGRCALLLSVPILLNIALNVLHLPGGVTGISWAWLLYFGLCSAVLLVGLATGWPRLVAAAPMIDDLVPKRSGQEQLARLLCFYLRPRPQRAFMVAGFVLGAVFLLVAHPSLAPKLSIGLPSYLAVAITGSVAGGAAYWVIGLVHFARRVQKSPDVAVRWIDPARTPGIVALAAGYTYGAPFGAVGLAMGEVPVLYAYFLAPSSRLVIVVNILAPLIAVAATVAWSVWTHVMLSRLIVSQKYRILEALNVWHDSAVSHSRIERLLSGGQTRLSGPSWPEDPIMRERIRRLPPGDIAALYNTIATSPESTFPTGGSVQYTAAFAALALPYIVRAMLHLLGIV